MVSDVLQKMRAHFDDLNAQQAAIIERARPLREERDRIRNEAAAKCAPLEAQIKEIEQDLFAIQKALGSLSRSLGGRAMSGS